MKISVKIFIGFSLVILFAILSFFVNQRLSEEINKNTEFLTTSEAIIRNSVQIHKTIIEMQSGFRGFLLTHNNNFLIPYYDGLKDIPVLIKEQKKLISNSWQIRKLDSIENLHNDWVDYANSLIIAKNKFLKSDNPSSDEYDYLFNFKLQKEVGKKINDELAMKFDEFDRHEYRVRQERRDRLTHSIKNTKSITLILAIITITIGLVSGIYIAYIISKRITKMVNLAERISKGKFEVIEDHASDELTNLSISLSLMSQKLDKSFTELERKNKELDQFAYVVSHDLKAPLRGMYNIINWIEEDYGTQISRELRNYLEMLKGRIERLEKLISGLLDYARIGRSSGIHEKVNVKELLLEIKDLLVPPGFKFKVSETIPEVVTDKLSLQQVFMNLISNAVKYHGGKSGRIEINCRDLIDRYEFAVKDDGIGIEQEYHEKIFAMFQTLREKNETESTGVGLAIVKKIIEEKKGNIQVYSEKGKGASFVFTWPKEKEVIDILQEA